MIPRTPVALAVLFGVSLFVYFFALRRTERPKAELAAVSVYVFLGLLLHYIGWNINPWAIILFGLFVALLNLLQLRQNA